jgi:hypothetical protein
MPARRDKLDTMTFSLQTSVYIFYQPGLETGAAGGEIPGVGARAHRQLALAQESESLPRDVFLGAHGGYYGMVERYNLLKKGQANAFVNPRGYKEYVAQKERAFRTNLAAQQGKSGTE